MSFDLYVWYEPNPITAAVADDKLERWAGFTPHPAVLGFCDELLARFPEDVWSSVPDRTDIVVHATFAWSRKHEVKPVVQALAARHGLVCYDPGDRFVEPNAPGYVPPFELTFEVLSAIPDPDDQLLEWAVGKVGGTNRWAALSRADGVFVQVAYDNGSYLLEYRDGDRFHTRVTDYTEGVRLFQEFRAGDDTFKRRHVWERY